MEPPPKKKKKSGSFCAVGGCSNRSCRDKSSAHPGRDFIRYIFLPKDPQARENWVKRMKRDLKTWKPSQSTKICTDHFFESDFRDDDLMRYRNNPQNLRTQIRLKPGTVPNTDRETGRFKDPFQPKEQRPPPKERLPLPQPARVGVVEATNPDTIPSMSVSGPICCDDTLLDESLVPESDHESSDDDQSDYAMSSDEESDCDQAECEFDSDAADCGLFEEEYVVHDSVNTFTATASWVFVSIPLLLSLFRFCPQCGSPNKVTKIMTHGFAIAIHYKCYGICPHEGVWRSSEIVQGKYVINLLFCGAAILCGLSYNVLESVMTCLSVPYSCASSFYRLNRVNLYPIIVEKWTTIRNATISRLKDDPQVDVSGDGHYDSPGWCAKYCTYSIMHMESGAILDFFICQKGMYKGDLETAACKEVLTNLAAYGLKIRNFVTDENTKIAKLVRTFFTSIVHNYDIWHKARLLKKKLSKIALKLPKISDLITPIVNHFWYSSKVCNGNPRVLVERFHSTLLHICNRHSWTKDPFKPLKLELQADRNKARKKQVNLPSEQLYPYFASENKCGHKSRAKSRKLKGVKWFEIGSSEFMALFKYLTDSRLVNSIKLCCNFLHTGGLEVYHNVRLKFLPKRSSYSLTRMIMGSMVTAIEINSNIENNATKIKEFWAYSKSQKKYVRKSRELKKDYSYRKEILEDMLSSIDDKREQKKIVELLENEKYVKRPIPENVTGLKIPSPGATVIRSRF